MKNFRTGDVSLFTFRKRFGMIIRVNEIGKGFDFMIQFNGNLKKNSGIANLTLWLIVGYAIGYVLQVVSPEVLAYLTLDANQILHGQVWRLVTWLVVPPSSFDIFTLLMLYFYYKIGTLLENIWGTAKYSRYILGGILLTIAASFLMLVYLRFGMGLEGEVLSYYTAMGSISFSTYYINLSIFMGYAATFPDMMVLYFFVIPLKVKVLGIIDLLILLYYFFTGGIFSKFAIGAALLNMGIFLLTTKVSVNPKQIIRRQVYQKEVKQATKMAPKNRHKCTICGQTEESNPELEFRFCSKCNGNYEYCSNHLFTHEHIK